MSPLIIHRNADDTVVGQNPDGSLWRGTPRTYEGSEVQRVVTSRENGYVAYEDRVGDEVIGGGIVQESQPCPTDHSALESPEACAMCKGVGVVPVFSDEHGQGATDHVWRTYDWTQA